MIVTGKRKALQAMRRHPPGTPFHINEIAGYTGTTNFQIARSVLRELEKDGFVEPDARGRDGWRLRRE